MDIKKDYQEVQSEQLLWGSQFHEIVAKRCADGTALPESMQRDDHWPRRIHEEKQRGVAVGVELKLAMTADFKPTGWFSHDTWFRCVVDAMAFDEDYIVAFDWKTGGKIQPEFEQLQLTAQVLFVHYPTITDVHTAYYWSQHNTEIVASYKRGDMVALWAKLLPEIKQMEEAQRTTTYPPKPCGLCVRYCPVKSCVYHGKGNRK